MMAAHITLRIRRPKMDRPYRTPGGLTSGVARYRPAWPSLRAFWWIQGCTGATIYGVLIHMAYSRQSR